MATPFKFEQKQNGSVIELREFFHDGTGGHTCEVTAFRPNIGDVVVTDTAATNPYVFCRDDKRAPELRAKVFAAYLRGAAGKANGGDWLLVQQAQLWYAPASGGALRITSECVDWQRQCCRHDRVTFKPIPEELKRGYLKLAMKDDSGVLPGICDDCGLAMVRVRSPVSSTGWWWCDELGDPIRTATDGKLPGSRR